MIQKEDFKDRNVEIIGETDERIEMGVDTENINHLMMILSSNLYQDAVGSIIREYVSNSVDSNLEAGNEEPVIVRIKQESKNSFVFETQDYGLGLDDKDFRNTISKYGKSTKRNNENQLGFYGQLGCFKK
jgi:DNA topoisomerase VI subunit B